MFRCALLCVALATQALAWTPTCKNSEVVTVPAMGSKFPTSAFSNPTFSVDIQWRYESILNPPPGSSVPNTTVIYFNQATQTQLNTWQSWWANTTGQNDQQLFVLHTDMNKAFPWSLRNVSRIAINTLRATFNTPANMTQVSTFWAVPGGMNTAWQGRILRAAYNQAYKRPDFVELQSPWWMVTSQYNGPLCMDTSTEITYIMPNYTQCEQPKYTACGTGPTETTASVLPLKTENYFYNETSKQLLVYLTARNTGNRTIDLTQGTRNISIQGTTTFVQKYIKEPEVTVPVTLTGVTHSVENLMSTRKDLPAFIWEEDSAMLIQLQLNQGQIPTPISSTIQATWIAKNNNDKSWSTVTDLQNKYNYVWIPVSLDDGDYDLFWDGAIWSRQYKAMWYQLPNNQTSFEISKPWYWCPRCTLRNIPALFADLYHWFFHNRNELYYAYTVPANATWTHNHKLRVTVWSNATDARTVIFQNSAGGNYYPVTNRSRAAVGMLEQEIGYSWSYNHRDEYTLLQLRNGWGVEPSTAYQTPLLTVNSTLNNPSLSCGGIYFNDLDVLLDPDYNFCWDWPDGCLDYNPMRLRKEYDSCWPFQDTRLNGFVQNSAQGPLRTRARIQNGNLAMEYRATNAVADWWVLIQLDNVTLSDTP